MVTAFLFLVVITIVTPLIIVLIEEEHRVRTGSSL